MTPQRILELAKRFKRQRIVVVGDVMLDHYIHGEVRRISPEAPVPIVEFGSQNYLPGGAANVARNLATLGAKVELVGVVGKDESARILRESLGLNRIRSSGLIVDAGRPTTVKTRVMASHQQILRIDQESRQVPAAAVKAKLLQAVRKAAKSSSAIIVADYAKGVIDQDVIDAVLAIGRKAGVPVCIDPKPVRRLQMKGCALLTPNRKETFELARLPDEAVGTRPERHRGLRKAVANIQRDYAPKTLLVTLGEGGMLLIEGKQAPRHLATAARDVFDVSGAGDTVIAAFVLAQAVGADSVEAATFANLAAGVVVGKLGAAAVTVGELVEWAEAKQKAETGNRISETGNRKPSAVAKAMADKET
jgi:D-beta-D-heptose 7-phosphate kinase/D-beta-D-heptose 1-phosphate adenosyltransferase